MAEFLVMKSQRNDVLGILQETGLDCTELQWAQTTPETGFGGRREDTVSMLRHEPTGYHFVFDVRNRSGSNWAIYRPGIDTPKAMEACGNWKDVLDHVSEWAQSLKRELDAPDLWSTLSRSKVLPAAASAEENTDFTEEEKARLNTALVEIKQYFSTGQDFSPQQKQYFDAQFEYLHGAIDRLGKKDWLHTAVGVIYSAVIGFGLSDHATPLLQFASDQISQAYGLSKEVIQKLLS